MRKLLILLIAVAILTLYISSIAFAVDGNAKIIYLKGQVKLQRSGGIRWITAKEGMAVEEGDRIKTFKFSTAEVALDKDAKNIIGIEQESEFLLEEIAANRHKLFKGKIFALLESLEPGSDFEVRTPTAVCGVAGSGISVDTDGNKTTAGCHEDQAYAKGIKEDGSLTPGRIIKEGYKCIIKKFEVPGRLIALTKREQREWSGFREGLREHRQWRKGKQRRDSRKIIDRIEKLQDRTDKRTEMQREDRLEKMKTEKQTPSASHYY